MPAKTSLAASRPRNNISAMIVPFVSASLMLWCSLVLEDFESLARAAKQHAFLSSLDLTARILAVLLFTLFVVRLTHHFVWQRIVPRRIGHAPPKLLVDMWALLLWILAAVYIYSGLLGNPVAGIMATSGVLVAIMGFALRGIIADIFSGIALGLERALEIGDWVELDETTAGQVVDMGWLTTRIKTLEDIALVVPNSRLTSEIFKNYSSGGGIYRDYLRITFDYDVTAWRAERILFGAVRQVDDVVATGRRSVVRIAEFADHGVVWELRFWVPGYAARPGSRYRVQRAILRNLHFAGVHVSNEKRVIYTPDMPKYLAGSSISVGEILSRTSLFACLDTAELETLTQAATRLLCLYGDPVVNKGDEGGSIFLLSEGMLNVVTEDDQGRTVDLGHLIPGDCFGEMSFLTGEPRSATVIPSVDSIIYEIDKDVMHDIMKKRSGLEEKFADILAERQMLTKRQLNDYKGSHDMDAEKDRMSGQIVTRIRKFFRLGG